MGLHPGAGLIVWRCYREGLSSGPSASGLDGVVFDGDHVDIVRYLRN